MFGIGLSEIIIVALVMVVVIKPEDLPKVFRRLGKWYGSVRKTYLELVSIKDAFLKEIDAAVPKAEDLSIDVRPKQGEAKAEPPAIPGRPEPSPLPPRAAEEPVPSASQPSPSPSSPGTTENTQA